MRETRRETGNERNTGRRKEQKIFDYLISLKYKKFSSS